LAKLSNFGIDFNFDPIYDSIVLLH